MRYLLSFTLILGTLVSVLSAQTPAPASVVEAQKLPSPAEISKKLQASLDKVKPACVSVFSGGYSSAVIISQNGHVLTVGHVVRRIGKDTKLKVTLENGATYKAKKLGYNEEMDIGLIQIINPNHDELPVVEMAKTVTQVGGFVFTYSHPSGKKTGRPAQVRLGRVTSVQKVKGVASHLYSDLNIQPGDSGGPLFDLSGKLVGINSSAAGHLNFNIFCCIDQYYVNRKRLENGDAFGDVSRSPEKGFTIKGNFTEKTVTDVHNEMARRAKLGHYKALDYYNSFKSDDGIVTIDGNELVNLFAKDSIFISQGLKVSMGLDDPGLVSQLPDLKDVNFLSYKIADTKPKPENEKAPKSMRATAVSPHLLIAKASLYHQLEAPELISEKHNVSLEVMKESKELDLVLLKLVGNLKLRAIKFPTRLIPIVAGQALIAPDAKGRKIWNVAMDCRRDVPEKNSIGPMRNKSFISKHRGPYKNVIRHSLPLYAAEAGTPIFDLEGDFIGIHIARFTRTTAVLIPHEQIRAFLD